MLAIRLQRTGRKGLAQYRVIVQEAQKSPKSERVVARLGHYNPHAKELVVNKEEAEKFLKNGAQPSPKVASLFKEEKIKLPSWVKLPSDKKRKIRNPEKLRKNQPKDETEQAKTDSEPAGKEDKAEDSQEAPAPQENPKETADVSAKDAEAKPSEADDKPAEA